MITYEALKKAMDEFILCLEEGRYYDAHEALEALWFPVRSTKTKEVMLIKGMINASVSFELYKRGRLDSSHKIWQNYEKYFPNLLHVTSQNLQEYQRADKIIRKIRSQFV
jgi:hypothetical protein